MDMRAQIVEVARRLTIERGVIPSLNVVAAASGASKGGLTHHFPTRDALVAALAREALAQVDAAMVLAGRNGRATETWLRLSVPSAADRDLFRALYASHHALNAEMTDVIEESTAAIARWEALMAEEVGDPVRARLVRLVGDGLAANAMISPEFTADEAEIGAYSAALGFRADNRE